MVESYKITAIGIREPRFEVANIRMGGDLGKMASTRKKLTLDFPGRELVTSIETTEEGARTFDRRYAPVRSSTVLALTDGNSVYGVITADAWRDVMADETESLPHSMEEYRNHHIATLPRDPSPGRNPLLPRRFQGVF